jgi:hypothetical protein
VDGLKPLIQARCLCCNITEPHMSQAEGVGMSRPSIARTGLGPPGPAGGCKEQPSTMRRLVGLA